jgi:hypothetical protein
LIIVSPPYRWGFNFTTALDELLHRRATWEIYGKLFTEIKSRGGRGREGKEGEGGCLLRTSRYETLEAI